MQDYFDFIDANETEINAEYDARGGETYSDWNEIAEFFYTNYLDSLLDD